MSYGRRPYYIYSDGEKMSFDCYGRIPEKVLNQFVYHVLLSHRRDDLKERLLEGKDYYMATIGIGILIMKIAWLEN